MRRAGRILSVAGAAVLLAGCTATVDGSAHHAAGPAPTGPARPLARFLPSGDELSATLHAGPTGMMGQLVQGGPDMLLRGIDESEAVPPDCVSVTYRLQQAVYQSSPVRSVATRSWTGGALTGPATSSFFGVVELAAPDDAAAFFTMSVHQWQGCNGRTMVLRQPGHGTDGSSTVSDVNLTGRVLSAVVTHDAGRPTEVTVQRALGMVADCVVDVEVTDDAGDGAGHNRAAELAELMLAKVAAGS